MSQLDIRRQKNLHYLCIDMQRAQNYKSRIWKRYRESRSYNEYVEYKRAESKATNEYRREKYDLKNNWQIILSVYAYVHSKT